MEEEYVPLRNTTLGKSILNKSTLYTPSVPKKDDLLSPKNDTKKDTPETVMERIKKDLQLLSELEAVPSNPKR